MLGPDDMHVAISCLSRQHAIKQEVLYNYTVHAPITLKFHTRDQSPALMTCI